LTDITLSVLDLADVVVLVVTQDIPSIKDGKLFLDLLLTLNIPVEKIAFVMNRYDKRIAITPEKIGENLKQEVLGGLRCCCGPPNRKGPAGGSTLRAQFGSLEVSRLRAIRSCLSISRRPEPCPS
jgi:Flp pilus assembly CpaE family ATPase